MATITHRKSGWSVQIRRKGFSPRSKTFNTKSEGQAWARQQESQIDAGVVPVSSNTLKDQTLGSLLARYLREVTPRKLSRDTEALRLAKLSKHPMCLVPLFELRSAHLCQYRDERLDRVKPGTVHRELGLLHHMLEVAIREWNLPLMTNPLTGIALPPLRNARDRRLQRGEEVRLLEAAARCRNVHVLPIIKLAIQTGLRRRELLELTWANIDLLSRTARIPRTKTGVPRTIPLNEAATAIIAGLNARVEPRPDTPLFACSTNAFKLAWRRVQAKAGLLDLRFHDLRHEALSRFCELGLSLPELAVISGHKDQRMLFRYVHLRAEDVAQKLAGRCWTEELGKRATHTAVEQEPAPLNTKSRDQVSRRPN